MSKVIKQVHRVEVSGYVRGYKEKIFWYDLDTKEILDTETLSSIEIIRDDTESNEDSLKSFNENLPFEIEEE